MNGKLILVLHYYSWAILRSMVPVVKILGFSYGFSHGRQDFIVRMCGFRHGFGCYGFGRQDTWHMPWVTILGAGSGSH